MKTILAVIGGLVVLFIVVAVFMKFRHAVVGLFIAVVLPRKFVGRMYIRKILAVHVAAYDLNRQVLASPLLDDIVEDAYKYSWLEGRTALVRLEKFLYILDEVAKAVVFVLNKKDWLDVEMEMRPDFYAYTLAIRHLPNHGLI